MESELHSNTSEYREHSQKSLDNGKLTDVETSGKLAKQTFSRDSHLQHSDFPEHSQNSWIKQVEVTVNTEDTKLSAASSDFPENSQNSLPSRECEMDNGEANMSFGDRDNQCFLRTFSKLAGGDRGF